MKFCLTWADEDQVADTIFRTGRLHKNGIPSIVVRFIRMKLFVSNITCKTYVRSLYVLCVCLSTTLMGKMCAKIKQSERHFAIYTNGNTVFMNAAK